MNKQDIGDRLTGLLILATSIPESLKDANGDPIMEELVSDIKDLAAELSVMDEVRWSAHGEPADTRQVPAYVLQRLHGMVDALTGVTDLLPGGDPDD